MYNPSRPFDIVKNMIEELGITNSEASSRLEISNHELNDLINNKTSVISPEMAVKLGTVFGSTADH